MTKGGRVDTVRARCILVNLQRTSVSLNPRKKKKGIEVLHAGGQKSIRLRSIRNGVERPHSGLL